MHAWLARTCCGNRRRALLTVIGWVVLAFALAAVAPKAGTVQDNRGALDPPAAAESARAARLLHQAFPDQRGTPAIIVVHHAPALTAADLAEVRRVSAALSGPGRPAHVAGVVSLAAGPGGADATSATAAARADGLVSADGATTTILVSITGVDPADPGYGAVVDQIRAIAGTGHGATQIRVTGPAGIVRDTVKVFGHADVVLLLLTLALVLILLLVIYRSPVLALLPLAAVGVAIQITNAVGAMLAKAGLITFDANTGSIMTVLLFGVGADYGLFLIMRYREELGRAGDRQTAMAAALRRVGEAITSSAATIVLALLLATVPVMRHFGPFLALGVLVMLAVSLTFLPALVLLLGRATFWPARLTRSAAPSRLWSQVGAGATRRPVAVALAALVVLGACSAGLAEYRENYNFVTGFRAPTDSATGERLIAASFPAGVIAPTQVLITGDTPPAGRPDALATVARAVGGIAGVRSVAAPTPGRAGLVSADGHTARLQVVFDDDPYGRAALARVATIRSVATATLASTSLRADHALVGGESASALDRRAANRHDLLVFGPVMLALIALVLGLLLRSAVAPLLLLATTVLSVAAALGVMVLVALTIGHGAGVGERVTSYVFVFLVALGVDYNIFFMARLREEARVHGHVAGIRRAVTHTGGVISSAGVILAGTFTVLMTQPIDPLYQFGLAMGIGLLLDTFLIRGVLLPALLRLLGRAAWWPSDPASNAPVRDVPARSEPPAALPTPAADGTSP